MRSDRLKSKLPQTMPLFWKPDMSTYTKIKLTTLLNEFLSKARAIAKGEPNTLTKDVIADNETYFEILGRFIDFTDENIKLLFSAKKEVDHLKYREVIWDSFGCSVIKRNNSPIARNMKHDDDINGNDSDDE